MATNIAETSITIEGVKHVVDSGFFKQYTYDSEYRTSALVMERIPQSSAEQRKGRAGRTCKGTCYRLYTEEDFNGRPDFGKCDFKRVNLTDLVLSTQQILEKNESTESVSEFLSDALVPPNEGDIANCLDILTKVGALKENKVTKLGAICSEIPIDTKYAKMLIYGVFFSCVSAVVTYVSLCSNKDVFKMGTTKEESDKIDDKKKFFARGSKQEVFARMNVYATWTQQSDRANFEKLNYLSATALQAVQKLREKVINRMIVLGLVGRGDDAWIASNENSLHMKTIITCIAAGNYPNLAMSSGKNRLKTFDTQTEFEVKKGQWNEDGTKILTYDSIFNEKPQMLCSCLPEMVYFACGLNEESTSDDDTGVIESINAGIVKFYTDKQIAPKMAALREQMSLAINEIMVCRGRENHSRQNVKKRFIELMNACEEEEMNLSSQPYEDVYRPEFDSYMLHVSNNTIDFFKSKLDDFCFENNVQFPHCAVRRLTAKFMLC